NTGSVRNLLFEVTATNNLDIGINCNAPDNNLIRLLAAGNAQSGVQLNNGTRANVAFLTAAANAQWGLWAENAAEATLWSLLLVANGAGGVYLGPQSASDNVWG